MTYEEGIALRKRREEMRKAGHAEATSIFQLAGFTVEQVFELANGYWPDSPDYDDVRRPWWLMLTEVGPIQIGWRKRVLHIDWRACTFRGVVTPDDVTKDGAFVHAYSTEKAVEYLKAMRAAAMSSPQSGIAKPGDST